MVMSCILDLTSNKRTNRAGLLTTAPFFGAAKENFNEKQFLAVALALTAATASSSTLAATHYVA